MAIGLSIFSASDNPPAALAIIPCVIGTTCSIVSIYYQHEAGRELEETTGLGR